MKMKWLLSIMLSLMVAAGIYQVNEMFKTYEAKNNYQKQLNKQLRDLEAQERELKRQAEHIKRWNELWAEVQKARVEPGNWFSNHVDISRQLEWPDMEQLLYFLSSGDPQTTGFWFKPEELHISRIDAPGQQGNGNPAPAAAAPNGKQMFHIGVQGEFLIPKLGGL